MDIKYIKYLINQTDYCNVLNNILTNLYFINYILWLLIYFEINNINKYFVYILNLNNNQVFNKI